MAYSIVAACVLLLRYEVDEEHLENLYDGRTGFLKKFLNLDNVKTPTNFTSKAVKLLVTFYAVSCFWISIVAVTLSDQLVEADPLAIILLAIPVVTIVLIMVSLSRQPHSTQITTFKVPLIPWFPALSIMINIYLMVELGGATWVRFGVWLLLGQCIYLFYGVKNSVLSKTRVNVN